MRDAEGERQKARGRRRESEGERQKARGRKREAERERMRFEEKSNSLSLSSLLSFYVQRVNKKDKVYPVGGICYSFLYCID